MARNQQTIGKVVEFTGIGIHTGKQVHLKMVPAPDGYGVVFQRIDLPGKPLIPATIEYVVDTARCTTIGVHGVLIHTVEHLLSAVKAFNIDNLLIEISDIEPPVGNGSADFFVKMIEEAGIVEQAGQAVVVSLKSPVFGLRETFNLWLSLMKVLS